MTNSPFHRLRPATRGRRRLLLLILTPLTLLVVCCSAAVAYFVIGGSAVTQAPAVGTAASLTVSFGSATGVMFPGSGVAAIPVTVTNPGSGVVSLPSVTASVNADGSGNITSNGTTVTGCLASWFSVSVTAISTPVSLSAGGTWTGTASVSMTNASVSQNACQGKTPDLTVTAT